MIGDNLGYVIGIDAGGTQSRGLLVDKRGAEVAEVFGPAMNMRQTRVMDAAEIVDKMVKELFRQTDIVDIPMAIAVGAAGAGDPALREKLATGIRKFHAHSHVYVQHDAFIALYGAFSGNPGVMVISGTGSIAFGRNAEGKEVRAGGWGWLLGDEGSGWWIGLHAVRAALAEWEGTGPATTITGLIQDRFNIADAYGIISPLYGDQIPRDQISGLAEDVVRLAEVGDEVARDLVHQAGRELGGLAARAARQLELSAGDLKVTLLGGVATGAAELIRPGVVERLSEELGADTASALVEPELDALRGAVLWARDTLRNRSYA